MDESKMSAKEVNLMRIDYSRKFGSVDVAVKEANRICEKVKREAAKNDYAVQMLIVVSDMDGRTEEKRPPHLHIMIYARPGDAVAKMIVSCINNFQEKHGLGKAATRHYCDGGYIRYVIRQCRKIRCFENDPDGNLSGLNIIEEAKRINPGLFRKRPEGKSGEDRLIGQNQTTSQPPCNDRYPREGACDRRRLAGAAEGMPERKKKRSKNKHRREKEVRGYDDLITRAEWLAKSPSEKACYYNSLHMSLNFFVYKMRLKKQILIDEFRRNHFVYDEGENKFKSISQAILDIGLYSQFVRTYAKNLIDLDEIED